MPEVVFLVEEAGCVSCAARVREALASVGVVETVEVDEAADRARVRLAVAGTPSEDAVNRALAEASADAGHAYRVRPGSFGSPSSASAA